MEKPLVLHVRWHVVGGSRVMPAVRALAERRRVAGTGARSYALERLRHSQIHAADHAEWETEAS